MLCCLAVYIADSARRSSVPGSVPSSGAQTMPALARTVMATPSTSTGSCRASSRWFAISLRPRAGLGDKHAEHVPAEAGMDVPAAQPRGEASGYCNQYLVTDRMAEGVVYVLEPVEAYKQQAEPLSPAESLARLGSEARSVMKPGERVGVGLVKELCVLLSCVR